MEDLIMNLFRTLISQKRRLSGALVSLTDPCMCEIMGNVGFDAVWIDMEHTYMSYKDVLCHINSACSRKIASVVRVPQNDLTATKKILEMGPDAIIFPMISSYEQAKAAIDCTVYPPNGTRGFGPMRAIGYGAQKASEYVKNDAHTLCRFIQIEDIGCIDDLEKIVKIPYLDGCIFGPNDLSGSLGDFMNVFGEKTMAQIKRAIQILRKHNKIIGIAGGMDDESISKWSSLDIDILFAGADWNFVYASANNTLEKIKKLK
jgi:2-dehydro-3-deoxyglucarate aldolase/4-hydroxy-2-oxoheptanedioate aldolase